MAIDWHERLSAPIEAVEHGLANVDTLASRHTGPRSWERMDYPVGEVMPEATRNSTGNEFTHEIAANLYFEVDRSTDYVDDILHTVAWTIEECLTALAATDCVVRYVPTAIEDFAGELDDTLLVLVVVRFEVTTLIDLAET